MYSDSFPLVCVSRKRHKDKSWITKGNLTSIRHKNELFRKSIEKPTDANIMKYNEYKKILNVCIKTAEHSYYQQMFNDRSNCIDALKVSLEKDAHRGISWIDNNYMDANPDKFQFISLDRFGRPPISISVEGNNIPSSDSIKVLCVTLDSSLQYDTHISILYSKASIQINAMKKNGKY